MVSWPRTPGSGCRDERRPDDGHRGVGRRPWPTTSQVHGAAAAAAAAALAAGLDAGRPRHLRAGRDRAGHEPRPARRGRPAADQRRRPGDGADRRGGPRPRHRGRGRVDGRRLHDRHVAGGRSGRVPARARRSSTCTAAGAGTRSCWRAIGPAAAEPAGPVEVGGIITPHPGESEVGDGFGAGLGRRADDGRRRGRSRARGRGGRGAAGRAGAVLEQQPGPRLGRAAARDRRRPAGDARRRRRGRPDRRVVPSAHLRRDGQRDRPAVPARQRPDARVPAGHPRRRPRHRRRRPAPAAPGGRRGLARRRPCSSCTRTASRADGTRPTTLAPIVTIPRSWPRSSGATRIAATTTPRLSWRGPRPENGSDERADPPRADQRSGAALAAPSRPRWDGSGSPVDERAGFLATVARALRDREPGDRLALQRHRRRP